MASRRFLTPQTFLVSVQSVSNYLERTLEVTHAHPPPPPPASGPLQHPSASPLMNLQWFVSFQASVITASLLLLLLRLPLIHSLPVPCSYSSPSSSQCLIQGSSTYTPRASRGDLSKPWRWRRNAGRPSSTDLWNPPCGNPPSKLQVGACIGGGLPASSSPMLAVTHSYLHEYCVRSAWNWRDFYWSLSTISKIWIDKIEIR